MQNLFKKLMPLLILWILIGTGCYKVVETPRRDPNSLPAPGVSFNVDLVYVALHIEDKNRKPPEVDAELLWNNRGHTPIIAPDGHQVTLGEFNSVTGKAEVTYINKGTNIAINLQGLIPNGLYSIWVLTFKLPGFHNSFVHLIGNGALGLNSGSGNTFTASSAGTAFIPATMHAQSLSLFGSVGDCLCSEYEVHLMAAYHSNNLIHNGTPGNPDSWVTQFSFPFRGGR